MTGLRSLTKIALIGGNGVWAKNYLKLSEKLNIEFHIGDRFNWRELINSGKCSAVMIVTPPDSHIKICLESIKNNLPIMVEKPLSFSFSEVKSLESELNGLIMVNYIHLFSGAFDAMRKLCDSEKIVSIESIGCGSGPFRNYSSFLDYAPHDLSMGLTISECKNFSDITLLNKTKSNNGELFTFELVYDKKIKHKFTVGNGSEIKKRYFKIIDDQNNEYIYDDTILNKLTYNGKNIKSNEEDYLEKSIRTFFNYIDGTKDYRTGLDLTIKLTNILNQCYKLV